MTNYTTTSNECNSHIVRAIQDLYTENGHARELFDWTARRERDASETSIDRLGHVFGWSRRDAVALAKALEEAGCGTFVVGRHGQKSRFAWGYSCIRLGQVASGEVSELQAAKDPVESDEDWFTSDDEGAAKTSSGTLPLTLTIAKAKEALARSLGVTPANIEIIVKA